MKKVTFTSNPSGKAKPPSAEQWVQQKPAVPTEELKRLTIDIPMSLHLRVKMQCTQRGVYMANVIREFLEREFAVEYAETDRNGNPADPNKKPKPSK